MVGMLVVGAVELVALLDFLFEGILEEPSDGKCGLSSSSSKPASFRNRFCLARRSLSMTALSDMNTEGTWDEDIVPRAISRSSSSSDMTIGICCKLRVGVEFFYLGLIKLVFYLSSSPLIAIRYIDSSILSDAKLRY